MMVNTKTAPRRDLVYRSFQDFERDVDAIEAADKADTLATTGNWSGGQIMEHLAKFSTRAFDGFERAAPWHIRKMAILMFKKKMLSGKPMPAGYKIPKMAMPMMPSDGVTNEEGIAQIRTIFSRLHAGETFTQASPLFEKLSHDEWCKAQLGHAAMHMSFMDFETDGNGGDGG